MHVQALEGGGHDPRAVKAVLLEALARRDRRDAEPITPHGLLVARGRIQAEMDRLLAGQFSDPANRCFAKHLRRYRHNLFVFLENPGVEATHCPAEQAIRMAVVNRKTCVGGNRDHKGAEAQSILMSVLQTARHAASASLTWSRPSSAPHTPRRPPCYSPGGRRSPGRYEW